MSGLKPLHLGLRVSVRMQHRLATRYVSHRSLHPVSHHVSPRPTSPGVSTS